jgi:hypothetical protein
MSLWALLVHNLSSGYDELGGGGQRAAGTGDGRRRRLGSIIPEGEQRRGRNTAGEEGWLATVPTCRRGERKVWDARTIALCWNHGKESLTSVHAVYRPTSAIKTQSTIKPKLHTRTVHRI